MLLLNRRMTYHWSKTWKLAYPVSVNQLSHVLVSVADVMMIGRVGAVSLAAASVANSLFAVIMVVALGFSYGLTPLVAQAHGADQTSGVGRLLGNSLLLNVVLSIFLCGVIIAGASFLSVLHQPSEVIVLVRPYLIILGLSLIPMMIFQAFKQFAEGFSHTKEAMVISIAANLINVLLNYALIFGKWGFPALGIVGAGIATLISRVVMAFGMFLFVRYFKEFERYWKEAYLLLPNFQKLKSLTKIGLPISMQMFFEVAAFASATIMMGWISTNAIAAHQIAINMASVTYMLATGLAAAATVRVGYEAGKKDTRMMREAGNSAFGMVFVFMGVCALGFIVFRSILPTFYINDPQVEVLASALLLVAGLFQLSDGVQVVGLGALRGMKDVKIPTVITFVAYWVLGLPLGYVFGFWLNAGAAGIWYGLLLGLTIAAVLLFVRFQRSVKPGLESQSIPDKATVSA